MVKMTTTEREREYNKEYQQRPVVRESLRAYGKAYRQRPEVIERKRAYHHEYELRNLERRREYAKERNQRARAKFLEMYGAKCSCCGETEERFLTLDHVNDNGSAHRAERGRRGILRDAISKFAPDEYQILCFNCNSGRAANGGICPHKSTPSIESLLSQ